MKFKFRKYPVLISPTHVPELMCLKIQSAGENSAIKRDSLEIGAAVSLTSIKEFIIATVESRKIKAHFTG